MFNPRRRRQMYNLLQLYYGAIIWSVSQPLVNLFHLFNLVEMLEFLIDTWSWSMDALCVLYFVGSSCYWSMSNCHFIISCLNVMMFKGIRNCLIVCCCCCCRNQKTKMFQQYCLYFKETIWASSSSISVHNFFAKYMKCFSWRCDKCIFRKSMQHISKHDLFIEQNDCVDFENGILLFILNPVMIKLHTCLYITW